MSFAPYVIMGAPFTFVVAVASYFPNRISCTPVIPLTEYYGHDVGAVATGSEGPGLFNADLMIRLETAGLGASFFRAITVQNHAGVMVTYETSAASYSNGPSTSFWQWGTGTNQVWDDSNVSPGQQFAVILHK